MKHYCFRQFCISLAAISLAFANCRGAGKDTESPDELWYAQSAGQWMEALPIGNGRLGAMVYGGVETETLALNESTMWSGQYNENQDRPFGRKKMRQLRRLFFEGKTEEGNRIASDNLPGRQNQFGTHLPVGDLKMDFDYDEGETTGYRRTLSLDEAVSRVSFRKGEITYTREYFSTNPDSVMAVRLEADRPQAISFDLYLDLMRQADVRTEGNQLIFEGKVDFPLHGPGGVRFQGRIAVSAENGEIIPAKESISVKNADVVTLVIDIRTDYRNPDYKEWCGKAVSCALDKTYESLRYRHVADYSSLYDRVELSLGDDIHSTLPTDIRWKQVRNGGTDTGLDVLFFQYGRYLTIASSRADSPLPIALQGFFNDNKACNMGWTNDYHLDINTQQNYWLSNIGNLAECNAPLFSYIRDLAVHGAKTAEVVYGCKGWTAHTTANVWGYTPCSGSISWGLFPLASSWIATHLWTHYIYTQDRKFLEETAWPLLKGNAEFILDYMEEDPASGYMMIGPSISPENSFLTEDGKNLCASMMPTSDLVLAREIFTECIEASEILDTDLSFADTLRTALEKFPPIRLTADGAVREWYEDYEEPHPNHRHTTHLLALYPFAQITKEHTPELAAAAQKTIEKRLSAKDWEDTEWSRANMICMYARLKDARNAYNSIQTLQGKLSMENLLTVSPGGIAGAEGAIYAFDGNTAGAAGMAEMLVQNHAGHIEFLPCLPQEWKDGSFRGLCLRGGIEASAQWSDGVLKNCTLKATADGRHTLKLPSGKKCRLILNGRKLPVAHKSRNTVTFTLKKGDLLELK